MSAVDNSQTPQRAKLREDLLRRLRDLVIVSAVPNAPSTGLIDVSEDQGERLVAQAARRLGISPAQASKLVGKLEDRLGTRLLNRTTRRISLTAEGDVYLEHARRILTDIEDMERLISSSIAAPKGLLRVNATLGFGRTHIAPLISSFAKKFPAWC